MKTVSDLGRFISKFPRTSFRRHSLIADGDDVQNLIYYLETGLVKQYCISDSGIDFMTYLFRPGTFFPPTVISGSDISSCYFEAFTPATVRIIPIEAFMNHLRSNSDLLMDLVTVLSRYFGTLSRRINQLAGNTAYQRTAAALAYLGERMGTADNGSGRIHLNELITHKELASWSGLARETASIHMKILEKKGLVSYYKRRILINDWEKLLRESGQ